MAADTNTANKHAYLILYHKNSSQLIRLLQVLDDERNDIYIHADKKTKDFPTEKIQSAVRQACLFFTKRVSVAWGGFSLVRATLILLHKATNNGKYAYYHLLSGQDLPIKTQDDIHDFFRNHADKEFIQVRSCAKDDNARKERLAYYRFFRERAQKARSFSWLFNRADSISLRMQKKLKINRIRGIEEKIHCGSEWFSISHAFAEYLLRQEKWIKKHFRWTSCSDEVFVQTIAMNSRFQPALHHHMRLVDWKRGDGAHPYVFRAHDFDLLKDSDCLFARKFDEEADPEIIDRVIRKLCCRQ